MLLEEARVTNRPFRTAARFVTPLVAFLGVGLVFWSVADLVADRKEHLDGWRNELIPAMEDLASDSSIDGRVSFGVSMNGMPALFEFYGDTHYGERRHTSDIASRYENLALFDLQTAAIMARRPAQRTPIERSGLEKVAETLYRGLPKYLPPFRDVVGLKRELSSDDLIKGILTNESVGRVAYLTQYREVTGATRAELASILVEEFGPGRFYALMLYGHEWEVFDVTR